MSVEKTGGWVHLAEYNEYYYGDIYKVGTTLIIRANSASVRYGVPPKDEPIWASFHNVAEWFDRGKDTTTIVARLGDFHFRWNEALLKFVPMES